MNEPHEPSKPVQDRFFKGLLPNKLNRQQRFEQFARNQGGFLKKGDRSGHIISTSLPKETSPKAPGA